MKRTVKALSVLLAYPSAELKAAGGEIREALFSEAALPAASMRRLEPLLQRFDGDDLMDLQEHYTELFDGSRALSLHLFEHVHGESRERGQALIDLAGQYLDRGFAIATSELADFVPLFLEFVSFLDAEEAKAWLARPAHVFAALEERLTERGSPYAGVFHALLALPGARPDVEALAALRARLSAEEAKSVDDRWEDAPVTFGPSASRGGGAPGVVARIRAVLRR